MPLHAPEELSTPRLRLRKLQLTDAPAIYTNWATDPEVTRFLNWPPHRNQRDTEGFLVTALAGWLNGSEFTWGMVDRATDELIGTIAVVALRDRVAAQPGSYRLWAYCDVENQASGRVLEKSGFTFEGRLHRWAHHPNVSEEPRDALVYCWIPSSDGS